MKYVNAALLVGAFLILLFSYFPMVKIENEPAQMENMTKHRDLNVTELFRDHYSSFFPDEKTYQSMIDDKKYFNKEYNSNGEYGYDGKIEEIVATQLPRFKGSVYCDYTGSGVYQNKQIKKSYEELEKKAFGNSHSQNPSAINTDTAVDKAREMIVDFFHTDLSQYTVIFTSGATGALKLVAESFPWSNDSKFAYLRSNHNSVLGIREVALDQGAEFIPITSEDIEKSDIFEKFKILKSNCTAQRRKRVSLTKFPDQVFSLLAFPAQDNFAGVKYPLEWINKVKEDRIDENNTTWITLLDAAAFVPTNSLNLTAYPADFVAISFYKMFGYPTGTGVLLVRNSIVDIMQKTFFGGGTVITAEAIAHFCLLSPKPCQKFEDGTINFLSINALQYGFEALNELGMDRITKHVWSLTQYLYDRLSTLTHSNGRPVIKIFGNHNLKDIKKQGSILNFIISNPFGNYIGYHSVQIDSADAGIHLRTGCSCNPGACYGFLGVSPEDVIKLSAQRNSCHDETDLIEGKPMGGVRVSFGYLSTFEDAYIIFDFFNKRYVDRLD